MRMNSSLAPIPLESYSLWRQLRTYVQAGAFGPEVLSHLLPGGNPHRFEKSLWDYKERLPTSPHDRRMSEAEKHSIDWEVSRIVKDVVSFYNSYGGYLVIGVRDNP